MGYGPGASRDPLKKAAADGQVGAKAAEDERKGLFPKFREKREAKKKVKETRAKVDEGERSLDLTTEEGKQRAHEMKLAQMGRKDKRREAAAGVLGDIASSNVTSKYM